MASIIDPKSANSLILEYQAQNSAVDGTHIMTPDGLYLNGYFIDRQSLETVLSDPKAIGISFYLAKHPDFKGAPSHQFTVLYAGAEINAAPNPSTPYINTGDIYGIPPPCPPICGSLPH